MTTYTICVPGCDDTTVVHVDLTPEEAAVVAKIARLVVSGSMDSGCKPQMYIDRGEHDYVHKTPEDL